MTRRTPILLNEAEENKTRTGIVVDCNMLNLRQYPIANGNNVLKTLRVGTKVEIIDEVNEFYKVTLDGVNGYVMKKFINVI